MNQVSSKLSIRELRAEDLDALISYWTESKASFMENMGVDMNKMPKEAEWRTFLSKQLQQNYKEKESYCLIWLLNNQAVGHSNVIKIIYGKEAYMHLHLWNQMHRIKGLGLQFVKLGIPIFFTNLALEYLFCEPYALNPAPNKLLQKLGFQLFEQYTGIPGWLNFEQPVNKWLMTKENYLNLKVNW